MTTCETLDQLIVTRIKDGCNKFIAINAREVSNEAYRISETSGKGAFRIVDSRLQVLRKKGVIRFRSETGWVSA